MRIVEVVAYDDKAGTETIWRVKDGKGATTEAQIVDLWRWLTGGDE